MATDLGRENLDLHFLAKRWHLRKKKEKFRITSFPWIRGCRPNDIERAVKEKVDELSAKRSKIRRKSGGRKVALGDVLASAFCVLSPECGCKAASIRLPVPR